MVLKFINILINLNMGNLNVKSENSNYNFYDVGVLQKMPLKRTYFLTVTFVYELFFT